MPGRAGPRPLGIPSCPTRVSFLLLDQEQNRPSQPTGLQPRAGSLAGAVLHNLRPSPTPRLPNLEGNSFWECQSQVQRLGQQLAFQAKWMQVKAKGKRRARVLKAPRFQERNGRELNQEQALPRAGRWAAPAAHPAWTWAKGRGQMGPSHSPSRRRARLLRRDRKVVTFLSWVPVGSCLCPRLHDPE